MYLYKCTCINVLVQLNHYISINGTTIKRIQRIKTLLNYAIQLGTSLSLHLFYCSIPQITKNNTVLISHYIINYLKACCFFINITAAIKTITYIIHDFFMIYEEYRHLVNGVSHYCTSNHSVMRCK